MTFELASLTFFADVVVAEEPRAPNRSTQRATILNSSLLSLTTNLMAPHAQCLSFSDPLTFRAVEDFTFSSTEQLIWALRDNSQVSLFKYGANWR